MTFELDFHDSELAYVERRGDALVLRFSAAHVHRRADSTRDEGYAKSLEAVFSAAEWTGREQDCVGRISDGHLVIGGESRKALRLPFEHTGPLEAEFAFNSQALLSISASAVRFAFSGDPEFAESYSC